MIDQDQMQRHKFNELVTDAYEHLYDYVRLRNHDLANIIVNDDRLQRAEQARILHQRLVDAVDELNPADTPVFSREWRRYSLMVLRYIDGLDAQAVADELGISRRHYYREHQLALEAVASIFWDRYITGARQPRNVESDPAETGSDSSHLELLRLEVERMEIQRQFSDLRAIILGVLTSLENTMRARLLTASVNLPDDSLPCAVSENLLRQIMIAALGFLVEHAQHADCIIGVRTEVKTIRVQLTIAPRQALSVSADVLERRISDFGELSILSNCAIKEINIEGDFAGLELIVPTQSLPDILVVDDNEDTLALFRRYLVSQAYQVTTTTASNEVLDLALDLQPCAIFLDLMMPDQDGWDLLLTLRNHPGTRDISIIVCSVLRQGELAMMLGATEYLEKPISEETLISILDRITES